MIKIELKLMFALYLFMVMVLLFLKPKYFFDKEKQTLKEFGVGANKNLCPMWLLFVLFGIVSFLLVVIFYL